MHNPDVTAAVNLGHLCLVSLFSVTSWIQSESPASAPMAPTAPANSSSWPRRRSPGKTYTQTLNLTHSLTASSDHKLKTMFSIFQVRSYSAL